MKNDVTIEQAWAVLTAAVAKAQPTGEIVIASGKGTNLYVRVNPTNLPASIALDLIEQGIRKPLTDISLDKESDEGNWQFPHERRLKRVEAWKSGTFSQRGGASDEIGTQMKEELASALKKAGLNPKNEAHAKFFKGNAAAMIEACAAAGMGTVDELKTKYRDLAVARLAERGEAAKAVDVTSIKL